jgi:hypothetical protein
VSASVQSAAEQGGARAKPKLPRIVHALLTVLLCAVAWVWLVRNFDLQTVQAQVLRLPPWAWAAAGLGLLTGHGLRALRLQREWRHLGHLPWWQCLRIVLAHNAMVIVFPLRSGEAGYLWAVRRTWGVGWGAAGLGLLRWRLQDISVLAVLGVALLLPVPLALRLALAVACALALRWLLPFAWHWLLERAGSAPASQPAGRGLWSGIDVSVANWTLKVLANGGLLAALAGLSAETGWRAALGGELAGVQPFQPPVGLGTYEAGIWFAAGQPHALASTIVAAALAVHAFSLTVALLSAGIAQLAIPAGALRREPTE